MIVRNLQEGDREKVDRIYDSFYSNNQYPAFFNNFHCPFAVADDNNDIILAGGITNIAEAVVLTDKSKSVRVRQKALIQALGAMAVIAAEMKHRQLYAFVNSDESYVKHLQKYGFRLIDAKLLVFNLSGE